MKHSENGRRSRSVWSGHHRLTWLGWIGVVVSGLGGGVAYVTPLGWGGLAVGGGMIVLGFLLAMKGREPTQEEPSVPARD